MLCRHVFLYVSPSEGPCTASTRSPMQYSSVPCSATTRSSMLCSQTNGFPCSAPPPSLPYSAVKGLSMICHALKSSMLHYQVVFHVVFNALQQRGLLCTATTRSSMLWHHKVWHTPLPRDLPYSATARFSMLCHLKGFHAQSPQGFSCPAITSSLMLCCLLCTATTRSSMHRYHEVFHALPLQGIPCYFLGGLPCSASARSSMLFSRGGFPWSAYRRPSCTATTRPTILCLPRCLPCCGTTRFSMFSYQDVFEALSQQGLPYSTVQGLPCSATRSSMLCHHKVFHALLPRDLPRSATTRSSTLCHHENFHALPQRVLPRSATMRPQMLCLSRSSTLYLTGPSRLWRHVIFHALPPRHSSTCVAG